MKIILVEDNIVQQDLMEIFIEDCGHEVVAKFTSAEKAETEISSNIPDLVLMDINLDGLKNGIELARELKLKWKIPVIFTTSQTDINIISKAVDNEPLDILIKPIQFEQLQASLLLATSKISSAKSGESSSKFTINDEYFIYKNGHLFERALLSDLIYIEGMGNYFNLYFKDFKVTLKGTLTEIEEALQSSKFKRINRSVIVSEKQIKSFNAKRIVLNNGIEFPLAKKISDELMTRLLG